MTTVMIQEARARDTVGIFADMSDAAPVAPPSGESAEAALAFLAEMSPDLRGAAILGSKGEVLAATGEEPERWADDAAALFTAADAAEGTPVEQVHIATEQGEVFAIRNAGLTAVTVTERFALASLMLFDMRSTLRQLATPSFSGSEPPKPRSDEAGED
jgi:predicted regulator of Ras-like GTPase activity (Roadblock/LC7/MglB family)